MGLPGIHILFEETLYWKAKDGSLLVDKLSTKGHWLPSRLTGSSRCTETNEHKQCKPNRVDVQNRKIDWGLKAAHLQRCAATLGEVWRHRVKRIANQSYGALPCLLPRPHPPDPALRCQRI